MKQHLRQWIAGVLCTLAVAVAAPAAHADTYELKAALRAGEVLEARLNAGDEQTARQVIGLFINAIHGYYESDAGEPAWIVWTPDMKQYLVATSQFGKLENADGIVFIGEATEGPLVGSKITGAVLRANDGRLLVVTQVENRAVNVIFVQPLQQLDLSDGTSSGN